ncbi:unnamed protein product [Dibothriocephalus latus]|uniref:Uncharacterized protein n=1 Tax=Dibothriocephalus latus TaxID=60516 RepID=A0A3P7RH41_DIBLA|nr:unnamed protein product [Dibothriocephalus latus]
MEYQLRGAYSVVKYLRRWYERHKNKPKHERVLYLPPRAYLQYACPTLICKLEEVLRAFANRVSSDAKSPQQTGCRHGAGDDCQCMVSPDCSFASTSSPV